MITEEDKDKLIATLTLQLQEKGKELHYKTAECEKWKTDYKNCSELEKMMSKERQYCLDNWRASEQDKISFTVEQLEKAKEKINDCPITDYDTNKHFVKMYQSDVIRQLDNQIAELTHQHEDKGE